MASFFHSVSSVLVILILTSVGYFVGYKGWMNASHKSFLSKFMMNIGLPCMCLNNLTGSLTHDLVTESLRQLCVPMIMIPVLFALSFALAKLLHLPRRQLGPFMAMCSLSNSIFVGYAMCRELFGAECTAPVMMYYLVHTALLQSVALGFIEYSGAPEGTPFTVHNIAQLFRRPLILSLFLSLLLIWFEIPLPSLVVSVTSYLGGTVSPLGLLFTGFIIYEIGLKNLRITKSLAIMSGMRFLVAPLLCLLVCRMLGVGELPCSVMTVESAMPCVTQSVVFSSEYGADDKFAAQGAALSTLLCFLVIPVLMLLL